MPDSVTENSPDMTSAANQRPRPVRPHCSPHRSPHRSRSACRVR